MSVDTWVDPPETKRPKLTVTSSLEQSLYKISEKDVGIVAFVSPEQLGFSGIIKNRWEDFVVHELNHSKQVCHLSSLAPIEVTNGVLDQKEIGEENVLPIEIDEVLKEIDRDTMFEASFPASEDKQERERFHKAIRFNYPALISRTAEVDGNKFVLVTKKDKSKGQKGWERRSRVIDPPKKTPFCHFILYKEGKDTMNALHIIGRMLKINANVFGYAGTKDKRAITSQHVSVRNISSKRLASLNPRLNGIKVGNFSYLSKPLALGDLYGNRFSIVIRDILSSDAVIHKAIADWQKAGFINYFGLQRFGHSAQAKTFDIGKHLIRSNWEAAIDLILKPTSLDLPAVRLVKEKYQKTQDAQACADDIPQCLEKTLLLGIARHGKTLAAILTLPRNLRQLYVHSYQSLVWNRIATRRVEELGLRENGKALPGDLFFPTLDNAPKGLRSVDSASELCYDDALKESTKSEEFRPQKPAVTPSRPRVALDSNLPLVFQVVLPLPGFDVIYPENASGKWYSEIMAFDSLKLEDMKHAVKDFAMPGSYRHLLVKPEDVSYRMIDYIDTEESLIESDLKSMPLTSPKPRKVSTDDDSHPVSSNDATDEKKRAVVLEFTLPKATYATMAIRELMKDVTVKQ